MTDDLAPRRRAREREYSGMRDRPKGEPRGMAAKGSRLKAGTRSDRGRLEQFTFAFSDGVLRHFWAASYDVALTNATTWALARDLSVDEGSAR